MSEIKTVQDLRNEMDISRTRKGMVIVESINRLVQNHTIGLNDQLNPDTIGEIHYLIRTEVGRDPSFFMLCAATYESGSSSNFIEQALQFLEDHPKNK